MESSDAVVRLTALAQETRLAIFRLLVRHAPDGLCAGDIQSELGLAAATLSFHLKELNRAGLIRSRQDGRFIYYAPDFAVMNELLGYLTENCCAGNACASDCAPDAVTRFNCPPPSTSA